MQEKPESLLTPIGFSYYASTSSLSPDFYLALLDRGWRRSGITLYKPDLAASCCPHYTIRLDSHEYHASKGQRQTLNRFNKYIVGDIYTKEAARLHPKSREVAKKRNTDFDLTERVHEPESQNLQSSLEPAHKFTVTLEPDDFTEEKYVLFENYQRLVHHEPPSRISRSGFRSFLCTSPLTRVKRDVNGQERELGSFHQCYRIDGKLIAIGVLDLLPQCVSAVYFMYDESVHQHALGKVGALREIALAKESGYRWWYAGFYIHSCVKMKYKGDYSPQYILDPESYGWNLLSDEVKRKLDKDKYLSLSRERANLSTSQQPHETATNPIIIDPEDTPIVPPSSSSSSSPTPTTTTVESPESDSDSDDAPIPDPDLPLYQRNIPGIMTTAEILAQVDLDHIRLRLRDMEAETGMLVGWEEGSLEDGDGIKGRIAELVAAVGVVLAAEMVVSFG